MDESVSSLVKFDSQCPMPREAGEKSLWCTRVDRVDHQMHIYVRDPYLLIRDALDPLIHKYKARLWTEKTSMNEVTYED